MTDSSGAVVIRVATSSSLPLAGVGVGTVASTGRSQQSSNTYGSSVWGSGRASDCGM